MSPPILTRSLLLGAIVLLCVAGAWVSLGLLQLHDGVPAESTAANRLIAHLCYSSGEETSGCLASAQSPWSEIRLAIPGGPVQLPVALLSIGYFLTLAVWYAFVGEAHLPWRPLKWIPMGVAAIGIYASLFFVSLMMTGRAAWCGGCITVHAINLLLVICIAITRHLAGRAARSDHTGSVDGAVNYRQVAAVALVAVLANGFLYSSRAHRLALQDQVSDLQPYQRIVESLQTNPRLMMDAYLAEPAHDIPLRSDEIVSGATHQLVVFLDYQCPACLITDEFIRGEIEKDFGAQLNVVVRHYPLCKTCNPNIPKTIHLAACTAAYAAEAARSLGGRTAFDRMSDLLFLNQPYLNSGIQRTLATQAQIDPERFVQLMNDPTVEKRVAEDIAQGHALHVTNTPTLFLDGRLVPQICMAPAFWRAVAGQSKP